MYLDLLLLLIICSFIVDISGIVDSLKYFVWLTFFKKQGRWEDIQLKPFSCLTCCFWWSGLIYLIVTGNFSLLGIAWVAFLSMMSSVITEILYWIREVVNWLLVKITPK